MKINLPLLALLILPAYLLAQLQSNLDYGSYHRHIIQAEELIADEKYAEALTAFEQVFGAYHFVFLRDYKVAAQLALFTKQEAKAFQLLKQAITHGLTLQDFKKSQWLKSAQDKAAWKTLKSQYPSLHQDYLKGLDQDLRTEVEDLFKKDQKLA